MYHGLSKIYVSFICICRSTFLKIVYVFSLNFGTQRAKWVFHERQICFSESQYRRADSDKRRLCFSSMNISKNSCPRYIFAKKHVALLIKLLRENYIYATSICYNDDLQDCFSGLLQVILLTSRVLKPGTYLK